MIKNIIENSIFKFIVGIILPNFLLFNENINQIISPIFVLFIAFTLPLLLAISEKILVKKISLISKLSFLNIGFNFIFFIIPFSKLLYSIKEAIIPLLIFLIHFRNRNSDSDFVTPILIKIANPKEEVFFLKSNLYKKSYLLLIYLFLYVSIINFINPIIQIQSDFGTKEFNKEIANINLINMILTFTPTIIILVYIAIKLRRITLPNNV